MEFRCAALAMVVPVTGLVVATWLERRTWAAVTKPLASGVFVLAGAAYAPWPRPEASALMAGLLLSCMGDLLLIPRGHRRLFAVGLVAFLLAHVAYSTAFLLHGIDGRATVAATLLLCGAAVPVARWLLPRARSAPHGALHGALHGSRHGALRSAVVLYIVAITAMVGFAAGVATAGGRPTVLVGGALFYLSDLCVARDRFVTQSRINGAIGLPLYYAGQLFLIDGMRTLPS